MQYVVTAAELVRTTAVNLALPESHVDRAFSGAPLDFPVVFSPRLPLAAHRFGMSGITLHGRVHLLESTRRLPPLDLLLLLRYEAEHVRQQRSERWFYVRYALGWLRGLFRSQNSIKEGSRSYRAYLDIRWEREARRAARRAAAILAGNA